MEETKTHIVFILETITHGKTVSMDKNEFEDFVNMCELLGINHVFGRPEKKKDETSLFVRLLESIFGKDITISYYGTKTMTISNISTDTWYHVDFLGFMVLAITDENGFFKAGVLRPSVNKIIPIAMSKQEIEK